MAKVRSYKPQPASQDDTEAKHESCEEAAGDTRKNARVRTYKPQGGRAATKAGRGASAVGCARRKAVASYKPGASRPARRGIAGVRRALPALVLLACAVAFVAMVPLGNVSAFGWGSIAAICPVGALGTLLASKTFVPRVVVGLAIAVVLILLFGRAFCAWACSVPLVERLLGVRDGDREGGRRAGASAKAGCAGGCESCGKARGRVADTRHWVLGGSLLSAAVFGFPVFCLVCPIGLTFATIYLVLRLFAGSASWALLVVPALLVAELLLARRWCHRLCPLGALMSLVARGNRTFVPAIDPATCLETTRGVTCGRCARACPEDIDLRHLAESPTALSECVKCRGCVEACPAGAIAMPLLPRKVAAGTAQGVTPAPCQDGGARNERS